LDETERLAARFEQHRPRLRAVAYRMLGSLADADDAVQDAWLRLSRSDAKQIDNLGGWLTTVVARECLHTLRSRRRRREDPYTAHMADLVVIPDGVLDPEQEALLADSVSLALLVVLDRLTPAERVAFVLHEMFDLPFKEIAGIAGRTPAAARQLASRARRRMQGAEIPSPNSDLTRQRQVVRAFYAAAWTGDFDAIVQVLDPDVVLRTDFGTTRAPTIVRGAPAVAKQARAPRGGELRPALVNGAIGALIIRDGRPFSVMAYTVAGDKIVRIDVVRDPDRVHGIASALINPTESAGRPADTPQWGARPRSDHVTSVGPD
jgi:RNA polymerase sigma factor (sigma-70 family)